MATAAIPTSIFQEIQIFNQTRRTDFQQLGTALQSGNLDAAKQAFNDLAAIGQSGPYRNAEPFSNSNRAQTFDAIGQALQSGDLAGAQAAFAALQSTFARNNPAAQQSPSASNSPAVVINIGQNSTTSGVTDTESIYHQLQDFRNTRQADLAQLGTALQSGNKTSAQSAYNALLALGQSGPYSGGVAFQRSDRAQAFAAIGQALQSGDIAGAQQAFANLAASFNRNPIPTEPLIPLSPQPTPGPVPEVIINLTGAPSGGPVPEVVINLGNGGATPTTTPSASSGILTTPATTPANTPGEIQINFGGNNGSSGGSLAIDLTPLQGNQSGERVKIDFTQGNRQNELIVNLFNSSAPSTTSTNHLSLQA